MATAKRSEEGLPCPSFSRRCRLLVREQKARFYILRRCVMMLVCWNLRPPLRHHETFSAAISPCPIPCNHATELSLDEIAITKEAYILL
ncbi:DVL family [Musa troglodytarum]|uniref:DVL family n=1 Tax=Musa troglodytarum TaxID=320322 RepID=A0A9E7K784_9LILI|nr:DVL family [Musa troglodytarum]